MTRVATKLHCKRIHRPYDYRSSPNQKTVMCCVYVADTNLVLDVIEFLKRPASDRCKACDTNARRLARQGRIRIVKVEKAS